MACQVVEVTVHCEDEGLIPQYASPEAAGADLRASLTADLILNPGQRALISTGLRAEIPVGYELQIRPRSGLALKQGITVLNTPGTIDSDYRGEIGVIVINTSQEPVTITRGMRIAQAVVAPVVRARFIRTHQPLQETHRGTGGFGHTGHH